MGAMVTPETVMQSVRFRTWGFRAEALPARQSFGVCGRNVRTPSQLTSGFFGTRCRILPRLTLHAGRPATRVKLTVSIVGRTFPEASLPDDDDVPGALGDREGNGHV